MTGALRVAGPADLIEVVPYLLGFNPTESAVLVGLADTRVSVTARIDLDTGAAGVAEVLRQLRDQTDHVVLVIYTEQPAPQWVTQPAQELTEALLVTGGRWFSLLCTDPACCPREGRALRTNPSAVAAAAVSLGLAPAASRDEIAAGLAPHAPINSDAAERAEELTPIPARDAAWIELDRFIGDEASLRALGAYYLETAQHCPQDHTAAAPWFLYAWAQWRLGDGARAAIALDNLAAADPDYTAAALLRAALRMGTDPRNAPALTHPPLDTDPPPTDAFADHQS